MNSLRNWNLIIYISVRTCMGMECEGFFLPLSSVKYLLYWLWSIVMGLSKSCFVTELESRQINEVVVFRIKHVQGSRAAFGLSLVLVALKIHQRPDYCGYFSTIICVCVHLCACAHGLGGKKTHLTGWLPHSSPH